MRAAKVKGKENDPSDPYMMDDLSPADQTRRRECQDFIHMKKSNDETAYFRNGRVHGASGPYGEWEIEAYNTTIDFEGQREEKRIERRSRARRDYAQRDRQRARTPQSPETTTRIKESVKWPAQNDLLETYDLGEDDDDFTRDEPMLQEDRYRPFQFQSGTRARRGAYYNRGRGRGNRRGGGAGKGLQQLEGVQPAAPEENLPENLPVNPPHPPDLGPAPNPTPSEQGIENPDGRDPTQ